jgi:uncharacterized membrane protein YphA (DoxX/SURF4 family)
MTGLGIPIARLLLPIVIALELVGAALLIVNMYVWAVSIAWIAFMIQAGTINFPQWITFWKNVSIAGGLLALILLDASRPAWLLAVE